GDLVYGFDPGTGPRYGWFWDPATPAANAGDLWFDTEVVGMTAFGGGIWVMTRNSLFELPGGIQNVGEMKLRAVAPRTGFADDLAWWFGHNGQLYAWLAKGVHRYDARDDVFEPIGLRGRETLGACSLGGWLIVG